MRDAIELQVTRNLLEAAAEEMGNALWRTAFSANIKERRDFSCALFDAAGNMIAQATHIPVHLGSMPASVEAVLAALPDLADGETAVVNDPYTGGSHLPDVTLVTPIGFDGQRIGFAANRAHHADVGGNAPGSMVLGTHIDEEGIRLSPQRLDDALPGFLEAVRDPAERRGDLEAQIHANTVGSRTLAELAESMGPAALASAAGELVAYSDRLMRETIAGIPDGVYEADDVMDGDGAGASDVPIRLRLTIARDEATADFTGSSPAVAGCINCPAAVTRSAVLYCFLCLLHARHDDAPLNSGAGSAIDVVTTPGSLLHAAYPSPVCAGNTETSQRVVDVTFAALAQALPDEIPGRSAGTMSSFALGDPGGAWTYYETIPGGSGAPRGRPMASAVQTHMTNTRNTPAEVLELQYPLRLRRYALTHDTPGSGVTREIEVLTDATATLLGDRGVGKWTRNLKAGDIVTIQTPSGQRPS